MWRLRSNCIANGTSLSPDQHGLLGGELFDSPFFLQPWKMKGLVWSLPLHTEMKGLQSLQQRHLKVGVLQIVLHPVS